MATQLALCELPNGLECFCMPIGMYVVPILMGQVGSSIITGCSCRHHQYTGPVIFACTYRIRSFHFSVIKREVLAHSLYNVRMSDDTAVNQNTKTLKTLANSKTCKDQ